MPTLCTIAPKTLRSIFITWLRNNTSAPEILKSAAHAQKHSEARQASEDYDQQADDRLVKAAYDFNLKFIAEFETSAAANAAAGGSSSVADAAAGGGEDGSEGGGEDAPPPPAAAAAAASSSSSPPRRAGGPVPSRQLPPIQQAEVNGMLADVGFSKSKAKGNGDCFPLSAMAGFEITASAARMPKASTTATVRELRESAISILTGDEADQRLLHDPGLRDAVGKDTEETHAALGPEVSTDGRLELTPDLMRRTRKSTARYPYLL